MFEGHGLDTGLRRQLRGLGEERIDNGQRLAAVVEFVDLLRGHGRIVRIAVTQLRVVVFDVAELLGLQIDVVLEALHVLLEVGLRLLELLRLQFESRKRLGRIVDRIDHRGVQFAVRLGHALLGLLQRNERVVGSHVFAQALLHEVDDIGALGAVGPVEGVGILVPLVEIVDLLILDVVVDLQTLDAVFGHQVLHDRGHDLLIELVDAEGHRRGAAILRGPHSRHQVVAHARTLPQFEGLVVLHILAVVELFVADPFDLLVFERRRVLVVGRLEDLEEDLVRLEDHLVHRGDLQRRDRLHGIGDGRHERLEHILELLGLGRERILELVEHLELLDALRVAVLVEDRDDGRLFGHLPRGELLEELQVVAPVGHQRQRYRRRVEIVHAIGDRPQRTLQIAQIVVLVELLDRSRIVVGIDRLGLLRTLDDRGLLRELLQTADGVDQQVVLARQLQRDLRFGNPPRIVDDEAPVLVLDLLGHRHIDHAEFRDLVVAEDLVVLFVEFADPRIEIRNLFHQFVLLDEIDKEEDNCQKPHPQAGDLLFELRLLLLEHSDLFLDALLLCDNLFSSLLIIVEQDFGLILTTIRRFRENFSFHKLLGWVN